MVAYVVEKSFRLKGLDIGIRWRVNQHKSFVLLSLSLTPLLSQSYLYCLTNWDWKQFLKEKVCIQTSFHIEHGSCFNQQSWLKVLSILAWIIIKVWLQKELWKLWKPPSYDFPVHFHFFFQHFTICTLYERCCLSVLLA